MDLTIDYLLSELNEYAVRDTPERFRIKAMFGVRHVLDLIGHESVASLVEEEISFSKNLYTLPDRIVSVEDVGLRPGEWRGLAVNQRRPIKGDLVFFKKTNKGIYFPNQYAGRVWILAYELDLDEEGNPLIPERAYEACKSYLKGQIISTQPTSPYYPKVELFKAEAQSEIQVARGLMNKHTPAELRLERRN